MHNPNIIFDHWQIAPIELLRSVVNEANLLASVMVMQPIIQAAISSLDTFDGTKSKFESRIESVEMQHRFWDKTACT